MNDTRDMERGAVAVFLAAGAALAVAEFIGIYRPDRGGDTISECVWWMRDRLPRWTHLPVLGAWLGFLAWLTHHFAREGRTC